MGRRFGFVRFRGVSDVRRLESQLDNIVVGGMKLFVNVPKYMRQTGGLARTTAGGNPQRKEDNGATLTGHHSHPQPEVRKSSYTKVLRSDPRNSAQRRNGTNASSNQAWSQSSAHIDLPAGQKQWYSDAWVGRLKDVSSFLIVEDDISWELGTDVVPKYLGDDMTLLLGLTDSRAAEMMKEEHQSGSTPFYSLQKWNSNIRTNCRLIWVRCWGIPIVAWNTENIRKIVSVIGDLVDIDDDVEERRRLDRARVLIRTPWKPILQHLVNRRNLPGTHRRGDVKRHQSMHLSQP
ncbi:hypothetical protein AAZV13_06G193000 [Glycine max]